MEKEIKQDVFEYTQDCNINELEIEKSNPYPRQDDGRWGKRPDLKVVNNLKPKVINDLKVISNKQFSLEVDKLYNGKISDFPNIMRLPNLNKRLAMQMGLNNFKCYFTKKQFIHSRPQRKGSYNQALRIDEFKRIPDIIHSSNVLYWDKRLKNFFIPFYDNVNKNKINKICFYKDVNGNFAITVGKVDVSNMNNKNYKKVGVGVAPTIHKSSAYKLSTYPNSTLLASPTYGLIIQDLEKMSTIKKSMLKLDYDGKNMLHKSFDIEISDITESNREKKIEQTEKALNAIYNKQPFVIRHIKAEKGEGVLKNLVLRISDFDKNKIEKAVHSMQFTLDTKIKASSGEAFLYKSQEELTDLFVEELTEKTKAIYSFVIAYFGLPEIRVLSKSDLKYKGKVVYDPETGKPISKAEWNKFVKTLEDFLNRNYKGIGKRIVLSAETLGRMLERLSKSKSLSELKIYIFYVHEVFTEDDLKKRDYHAHIESKFAATYRKASS